MDGTRKAMALVPCRNRALAWWGDELLAASARAIRSELATGEAELWFPLDDLCPGALEASGERAAVLRTLSEGEGPADLAGYAAVNHERVRIELEDLLSDDPRDATVKRFPTWGDSAHLIDVLDVQRQGENRYLGTSRVTTGRAIVEGSQMLAQALVAVSKQVPGRRVVSAHMVFCRPAKTGQRLGFVIDEHAVHRTMATLGVRILQADKTRAVGTFLLDAGSPDVIRHAAPAPFTTRPYGSVPYDMGMTGRDVRVVDGAYSPDLDAPVGPPIIDAWLRFGDLPDEQCLHSALIAEFTGRLSISAALRPHPNVGLAAAHHTLSTAVNAISLSFHADARADRWLLYRHRSTFAGDGMTHSECRVYTELGELVASFTVDAMVRPLRTPDGQLDARGML